MRLFEYYEGDSFLHRLNPTIKLLAILILLLALLPAFDPFTPLCFLVLAIGLLWLLGRVRLLSLLRTLLPFWVVALGLIIANGLFYNVSRSPTITILLRLGPILVTREGLLSGLSLGLRVLAVVSYSMLFVMTTDPTNFVLSLIQQAHLPYRFGYGVLVSYRFLPMLQAEYDIIRAAHKVRGIGERTGWRDRWEQMKRYAIPLLASAIRRSERVALAMDSRAFGAAGQRSYYHVLCVRRGDWVFLVALALAAVAILLTLAWLGLLRGYGIVPE